MHSRHRTIDDMMGINDNCNPFHYIQGQGITKKKGKYVWKNFSTPKSWADEPRKINIVKNIISLIKEDEKDLKDTRKEEFKDNLTKEISFFQDKIKNLIFERINEQGIMYNAINRKDYLEKVINLLDDDEKDVLESLKTDILGYVKPISPEQAVPYVEKIMNDSEVDLIKLIGKEDYINVKRKLEENPITDASIYNVKDNKLFFNASDFEGKISGLQTDLKTNFQKLSKPEFNYMRHIISTLDPNGVGLVVDSEGVLIRPLNTNFNMYDTDTKEYVWYADEYYWIDSLWEIKVNTDIFKFAVEYKYYTNNEDVVYNYGKQMNYINEINKILEKDKKMEEKNIFQSSKDLSIVMSASKMGFDIEKLDIENLEYKAMVLGMLSNLKQTPVIDDKTGKIIEIKTQSKGGLNSKDKQDALFKDATILFVIAMQDTIIGLNYSDAIRYGKISLTDPLKTTKLTFSAYSNKKNRKVKSIGITPEIFTPIKIGKITENIKYSKTEEDKHINEFVEKNYNNPIIGTVNTQKSRLKNWVRKKQDTTIKNTIANPDSNLLEAFKVSEIYKNIFND